MTRRVSVVAMMVFACLCAVPAAAQDDGDSGFDPQRLDRLWRGQWRNFASEYFMYEGQAHVLLNYKPRATSSLPLDRERVRNPHPPLEMRWQVRGADRIIRNHVRSVVPHDEDVHFAMNVLPRVARGHFGYILRARIIGPVDQNTVKVDDLTFIDNGRLAADKERALGQVRAELRNLRNVNLTAEQINDRLFIHRTAGTHIRSQPILITGLTPEQMPPAQLTIRGPLQLALIDRGRGLEGVPMSLVRPGLTEEQFIAMLEARGKSKEEFASVIAEALDRRLPTQERERAIRRYLEDFKPEPMHLPEQPSKPDTVPTPPRPRPETPAPKPRPRQELQTYFEDLRDDPQPPREGSIFDFGRDL